MASRPKFLSSPDLLSAWLMRFIPRWFPGATAVRVISIEPLGSIQPNRKIIRLVIGYVQKKKSQKRVLYINQQPGVKRLFDTQRLLIRNGFGRPPLLSPQPLFYHAAESFFIYESIEGTRVRDLLEKDGLSFQGLTKILILSARWLRRFHALQNKKLPITSSKLRAKDFAVLPKAWGVLASVDQLNRHVQRIEKGAERQMIHGDPHLANMILPKSGRLAFIDLSECRQGNRWYDIGMFLVHLDVALHRYFSEREIALLQKHFLHAYQPDRTASDEWALSCYKVRAALDFLKLTAGHHQRPRGYMAWVVQRLRQLSQLPS